MKKISKVLLLVILTISLVSSLLAGCGKKDVPGSTGTKPSPTAAPTAASSAAPTTAAKQEPEPNTLPIVKEPLKLKMWATLSKSAVSLKTFDDMLAYQELQKRTGIDIEFLHPPVGNEKEQFNLLIASQQLPDIIEYSWMTVPGGPGQYIKDKVIIPLNDPIKKYAPNLTKVFEKYQVAKKDAMMDDGTFYMFPCIYGDPELQHATGPIVRGDWLAKLGAQAPTTIAEWHDLLVKVKNTDLNGNGQKDEIPFTTIGKQAFNDTSIFVGAWGLTTGFQQNKGKIEFGPMNPKYKEFLQTMANWYKEGLIDPELIATKSKELDGKVTGDKAFAFTGSMGSEFTRYTGMMKSKNPEFKLQAVYYPVLNKGDKPIVGQRSNQTTGGGAAITTATKNVKEAVKLLDYNFSTEGQLLGNFGIEGKTYNMVNNIPTYTDLILKNPDGLDIGSAISKYAYHSGNSALVKPNHVTNQRDSLPEQLSGRKLWMETLNEIKLPNLLPTSDESKEFATIMNEINSYADEMFANFITGKAPISDYDKFVSTMKSMGVEKATQIMQGQMDRYSKRP